MHSAELALPAVDVVLAMWTISPGLVIVLTVALERRPWRARDQYLSFLYGDLALGVCVGAGATSWIEAPPDVRAAALWCCLAGLPLGLALGVVQGVTEVRSGTYTRGQALSPTKLWHQAVILPILGSAVVASTGVALLGVERAPAMAAVVLATLMIWTSLFIYDRSHPKPAHVEFYWRATPPSGGANGGQQPAK